MPINFSKNNITSLIYSLLREQKTGVLSVKIPGKSQDISIQKNEHSFDAINDDIALLKSPNIVTTNFIYFCSGRITYAYEKSHNNFSRLKDYLQHHHQDSKVSQYLAISQSRNNPISQEYDCLIWLLEKNYLSSQQFKAILNKLIKETIFELFIARQSIANFQENYSLTPVCYSSVTEQKIYQIQKVVSEWKKLYPLIISPHQYLYLQDKAYLKKNVSKINYQYIVNWSDEQKTFIQLSRQLDCSIIDVGKTFYPYIKQKLVTSQTACDQY